MAGRERGDTLRRLHCRGQPQERHREESPRRRQKPSHFQTLCQNTNNNINNHTVAIDGRQTRRRRGNNSEHNEHDDASDESALLATQKLVLTLIRSDIHVPLFVVSDNMLLLILFFFFVNHQNKSEISHTAVKFCFCFCPSILRLCIFFLIFSPPPPPLRISSFYSLINLTKMT